MGLWGYWNRRGGVRLESCPPASHLSKQIHNDCHADCPTHLRDMLVNVRSTNNKSILIQEIILDEDIDLTRITNTWLGKAEDVNLSLICLLGFGVWHLPWAKQQGGGVAVVDWKTIMVTGKPVQQLAGLEC